MNENARHNLDEAFKPIPGYVGPGFFAGYAILKAATALCFELADVTKAINRLAKAWES